MANTTNNKPTVEQVKLVADWAKAQASAEEAQQLLEEARAKSGAYAKALYAAFGTEPFASKSLGRKYRAIHKKGGANKNGTMLGESWAVLPLAENAPTREFP